MTHLQTKTEEQRQQLLDELPDNIAHIMESWERLSDKGWSQERARALFEFTQKQAGICEQIDLFPVSETLFLFEVYLSSFIDSEHRPNQEQIEDAVELLNILQHTGENYKSPEITSCHDENDIDLLSQAPQRIFYLRSGNDKAPELVPSLEYLGHSVLTFMHADDLLAELEKAPPQVLIFDIQLLPSMRQIIEIINHNKKSNKQHTYLICLSHSNDAKLSLQATRCGAQAFYVQPFDIDHICQKITQLAVPHDDRPYRVVVVDDDPAQADYSASVLKKAAFEVISLTQPLDVLDVLYDFKPDLILMDIYMPDANGIELTTAIRTHSEFVATPIVFLSGEQNSDKQLDALCIGGDDFIAKPIRPKHLITNITNRIRRYRELHPQSDNPVRVNANSYAEPPGSSDQIATNSLFTQDQLFDQLFKLVSGELADNYCTGFIHFEVGNTEELRESIGRRNADKLINAAGGFIIEHKEQKDIVAKSGDAVFAILMRRTNKSAIKASAVGLLNAIKESSFTIDGSHITPACNIGLRLFDTQTQDIATLISDAEQACRQAKKMGDNQIIVHNESPEVLERSTNSGSITQFQEALDEFIAKPHQPNQLITNITNQIKRRRELHSQSEHSVKVDSNSIKSTEIIECSTDSDCSIQLYNALNESFQTTTQTFNKQADGSEIIQLALELLSDDGSPHSEAKYLPVAREAGLVEDIDRLIMLRALSMLDKNRQQGKFSTVLIHQNSESLADNGRISWTRKQLRSRQMVGSGLILGFNLADLANDLENAKRKIEAFKEMGVTIAIFNFKPGSSALKVLRLLGAEYVVMSMNYVDLDQKSVTQLIQSAHSYRTQVIIPYICDSHWLQVADYSQDKAATLMSAVS